MNDPFIAAFSRVDAIDDTSAKLLSDEVESFLRAGGSLDAETWGKLHAVTRGAFIVARRKIDAEKAQEAADLFLSALLTYYGGKAVEAAIK